VDLKQIKELIAAMGRGGIKKLIIKEKAGYEIHLERHDEHPAHPPAVMPYAYHQHFPHIPSAAPLKEAEGRHSTSSPSTQQKYASLTENPPVEEKEGRYVTAPLVGTFYNSSSPDDPPFIKVGDRVEEHSVLCIIEAMKVMNEVKAGVSGILKEILVDNAHPVEFGTKMFRIL
jgi:acetyl-CoA carboxylase biotin carboxyl carrier protein